MDNNEITVFVVDDEPLQSELHTLFLAEAGYQTMRADNGKDALTRITQNPSSVHVILSDVSMPEMDGYEFCRHIKTNEETKDIPFIFVSSLTDIDEKLKGYEVGGDDYVSKPISTDELLEKVKRAASQYEQSIAQKQQLSESFNAAMQAMTYSSDLGQILEFYKNSLNAKSFDELAEHLFRVMNSYQLRSTLHIVTSTSFINIGDRGSVSPLEENVIELARQQDRFWDFGARTMINYENFSLLIKNMPIDDPERYGTLKDSLGSLCNAIEACIKILLFDDTNQQNANVLDAVRETLVGASQSFQSIQKDNLQTIQDMTDKMDDAIMNLGLSDHQENMIRNIAIDCYEKVDAIFDKGVVLNDEFEALDKRLTQIFSR
ncbi:MAG: response regulator [Ectothiorhodospiraceae bacterium]|nr:response regulator [Ectothiorhodospiraceae bacterium]